MEDKEPKEPQDSGIPEDGRDADPFGEYTAPKASERKEPEKKRKPSTKVAYAAMGTAIAIVAAVITVYLPVKIMPLVLAAFCFFLVYIKCGIGYGLISAAATALVTFFCGGLNTSLVFLLVCFVPYSLVCLPLRRFTYRKPLHALIRAAVAIVIVNITFAVAYLIARYAVLDGLDVMEAVGKIGYLVIALAVSAVAVITDILFTLCDKVITPKIK